MTDKSTETEEESTSKLSNEEIIKRNRGKEIYGARDKAIDGVHQRQVNSNGYGY